MSGNLKAALQERLDKNYKAFLDQLQGKSASELIAMAPEITAAKQVHEELPDACDEADLKFLLRFNDPLEVVRGYWESEITGYDHSGEMSHMLWDIQDRGVYSEDQLVQLGNEAHSRGKNAMTEDYDHIELFEKPALFSNFRIDRSTVPDGWHCYDIRGSDDDPGDLSTVEFRVIVNHSGTILCPEEIDFPEKKDYRPINGDINFIGESVTVAEFCEQHHIPVPSPSVAMKQPQKKNRSNAYER